MERRFLVALLVLSLVPSMVLLGTGAIVVFEAVKANVGAGSWDSVRRSGAELVAGAERSADPALVAAAREHREILAAETARSRGWARFGDAALWAIPAIALALAALLLWVAVGLARGLAREVARPIGELAEWAGRVARGEPLPPPMTGEGGVAEFAALRHALREMSAELERARARALEEEGERARVALARGVAQQLGGALTPLRLAVAALWRATHTLPGTAEPLAVIGTETERLEEMARSFAQLAGLPEGSLGEVDLAEQLAQILRAHLPASVEHRLKAPIDLPRVQGDREALARLWTALIQNAADAMADAGGTVTVKMASRGDLVEVRVLDSGPGISEDRLERIWEAGYTTRPHGAGLGLALARQTVLAHGGGIGARNRAEGGAELRVVLPVRQRTPAADPHPAAG